MPIFIFWSIVRCPFHLSPYPSSFLTWTFNIWLLLLLSRFSCVRLCATPWTAAHQALLSLGFSRQEHWSGLPFPSPMHESEKWKWSHSVVSDSSRFHGLQPTRHLHPWDFPGKSTGVGCHCLLHNIWHMWLIVRCRSVDVAMKNKERYMKNLWLFKIESQKPNGTLHKIALTVKYMIMVPTNCRLLGSWNWIIFIDLVTHIPDFW